MGLFHLLNTLVILLNLNLMFSTMPLTMNSWQGLNNSPTTVANFWSVKYTVDLSTYLVGESIFGELSTPVSKYSQTYMNILMKLHRFQKKKKNL